MLLFSSSDESYSFFNTLHQGNTMEPAPDPPEIVTVRTISAL
jgi:hypothetical protein